jgi:hypothetical protein
MIYEKLSKREATVLKKYLRKRHGNLADAIRSTGLNANTIKRASDGLEVLPANIELIKKLLPQ